MTSGYVLSVMCPFGDLISVCDSLPVQIAGQVQKADEEIGIRQTLAMKETLW